MANEGKKLKVVVCRDLGPDVMPLLLDRKDLDVRILASLHLSDEPDYDDIGRPLA